MNTILRQIRTDLRLSMKGIIATSMRKKGMNYRMNFGVDIPKIHQIVKKYTPDKTLAEILWKEDVRELKILATLLYPKTEFSEEVAERWVLGIPNQEIREQVCKNLFQEMPFSDELVQRWTENEDAEIRATGYWLFARLCIIGAGVAGKIKMEKLLENAVQDVKSGSVFLRQAALNSLKYYGRMSKQHAESVLQKVSFFETSENAQEKEMFELLRFEFEYVE